MDQETLQEEHKKSSETFDFLPFCRSCTEPCCNGYLVCTEKEYGKIVKFSGKHLGQKKNGYYEIVGDPCPYLDQEGLCSVYPVRPRVCQMYPYYPDVNDKTHKIEIRLDQDCPACYSLNVPFRERAHKLGKSLLDDLGLETYIRYWYD